MQYVYVCDNILAQHHFEFDSLYSKAHPQLLLWHIVFFLHVQNQNQSREMKPYTETKATERCSNSFMSFDSVLPRWKCAIESITERNAKADGMRGEQRAGGKEKKNQASKLIFQSCLLFQEGVTCSNDLIPLVVM